MEDWFCCSNAHFTMQMLLLTSTSTREMPELLLMLLPTVYISKPLIIAVIIIIISCHNNNEYISLQAHYHWQIVKAKFVRKHGPRQQVCDLQCKRSPISITRCDQISDFVVNANAESSVDVITVEQPPHADQHQVQVVDGWALYDPVHPTCHELNTHSISIVPEILEFQNIIHGWLLKIYLFIGNHSYIYNVVLKTIINITDIIMCRQRDFITIFSCIKLNTYQLWQEGQHPLTGQCAPPISGGT